MKHERKVKELRTCDTKQYVIIYILFKIFSYYNIIRLSPAYMYALY